MSNILEVLGSEGVPAPALRAVAWAMLRYIDAELLNALLLRRDCCSVSAAKVCGRGWSGLLHRGTPGRLELAGTAPRSRGRALLFSECVHACSKSMCFMPVSNISACTKAPALRPARSLAGAAGWAGGARELGGVHGGGGLRRAGGGGEGHRPRLAGGALHRAGGGGPACLAGRLLGVRVRQAAVA